MRKRISITVALFLNIICLQTWSNTTKVSDEELEIEEEKRILAEEFFSDDELKKYDIEKLDELENFGTLERWENKARKTYKLHEGRTYSNSPFRAFVPVGTIIRKKDTWEIIKTSQKLYVVATPHTPYDAYADLIGKDGKTNYYVQINQLRSIEKDLDLGPEPKEYETYPEKKLPKGYDKISRFENFFYLKLNSMNGEYFSTITNKTIESLHTQSVNFASYLNWDLPINIGLTLSYSNFSETLSNNERLHGEFAMWGPSANIPLKKFESFELFSTLSFQNTLRFNLDHNGNEYKLTSNALKTSISAIVPTWAGKITVGFGYDRLIPKLENTGSTVIDPPQTKTISVYSLQFGYNINLNI